jgi:hypothetical protein
LTRKITVANPRYAQYYIAELKSFRRAVINFSDIMRNFEGYVDQKFKRAMAVLPVVLLSLVYSGNA